MKKLDQLNFDNTFSRLPDIFHSRLNPTPLPHSYLVSFNASAAELINLDVTEVERADFTEYFIGNRLLPGSEPLSMLYAGHQFGYFVPQLGDGRAILLGEIQNSAGEYWDIQLKGAGITPYSRDGDGRAVLRSSIREYLCSEAMHGLGIPTSRALCIVGSDAEVYRETIESAAVVTRLSPSHVRFGSFEVFAYRGQHEPIALLADYVIAKHFPDIGNSPDKYLRFLNEVITRTANLMAKWQAVGFAHGVMNTDNMSILGLTFDYGPFGFMETYDPGFICNHSDHGGRYAFDQQPQIGLWNLSCLAQALTPIIAVEEAQEALENYEPTYFEYYIELMGKKLGLTNVSKEDVSLITPLLEMMRASQLDYTNLFRSLGRFKLAPDEKNCELRDQFIDRPAFDAWAEIYRTRLHSETGTDEERKARMDKVNPKYILRNSMAQSAIAMAERERNFSEVDRLLALLSRAFDEQ
ncbi:MAG: YdiU family protein, partial [Proteobacteria bacterium]|nr:YdiU family protein [Pseudomonadota bacterium]